MVHDFVHQSISAKPCNRRFFSNAGLLGRNLLPHHGGSEFLRFEHVALRPLSGCSLLNMRLIPCQAFVAQLLEARIGIAERWVELSPRVGFQHGDLKFPAVDGPIQLHFAPKRNPGMMRYPCQQTRFATILSFMHTWRPMKGSFSTSPFGLLVQCKAPCWLWLVGRPAGRLVVWLASRVAILKRG